MYSTNMESGVNVTLHDPRIPDILFGFLLARCALSALILTGSGFTIAAVCRYKRLRTSPNCVILSLTVADLLGGLLNPALLGLHFLRGHALWRPMCFIEETLDLVASGGAVLSVCLVAVDRYIHVVRYLNYQHVMTRSRLVTILVCAWFYVGLISAAVAVFSKQLGPEDRCSWTVFVSKTVYYYVILPQIGVLSLVMLVLYTLIGHFVYSQRRQMAHHRKSSGQTPHAAWSNSRTNSMIAIVVCAYFTATFPALSLTPLVSGTSPLHMIVAQQAAILLWYGVSAANPLIYVWRNPDFRWAFRRLLCIADEKEVPDTDVSSTRMTAATVPSTSAQRH